MPRLKLLQHQRVLAGRDLLFPSFDFGLAGGGEGVHDSVHEGLGVSLCAREFESLDRIAFPAFERGSRIVLVFFAFFDDRELLHLCWGFFIFRLQPNAREGEV